MPPVTLNRNSLGSIFPHPQKVQFTTPDKEPKRAQYSDLDFTGETRLTISADYNLSYLNFSTRSKEAQSILTWRDMYLHGGKATVEIDTGAEALNKIYIGAGAAGSFHGNWIDDDSNNTAGVIGVTDSSVTIFDLDFSLGNADNKVTKKFGLDFSWLGFKNYNYRPFSKGTASYPDISGSISTYDQYMLGLYGSAKIKLIDTAVFYADLGGKAGLSIGIGEANWLLRSDLEHPASFRSIGMFLRAGGTAEIGFKIKMITFFASLSADYQVSPWLSNLKTFYKDGHTHEQGLYQDLTRASCNVGLKASF
jgi:hypothetical protein